MRAYKMRMNGREEQVLCCFLRMLKTVSVSISLVAPKRSHHDVTTPGASTAR